MQRFLSTPDISVCLPSFLGNAARAFMLALAVGALLGARPAAGTTIYWTESGSSAGDGAILRAADRGGSSLSTPRTLVTGSNTFLDVAVDSEDGLLFWQNGAFMVSRSNLDGSAQVIVRGNETGQIFDFALDTQDNQIYWASKNSQIDRATYSGTGQVHVQSTAASRPQSIALDVPNDHLYWVETFEDAIERSTLSGTGATVIQSTATNDPGVIAVDGAGGFVYWSDSTGSGGRTAIRRATLSGGDPLTLLSAGANVNDIEVDPVNGFLYWATSGSLHRANLDGSGATTLYSAASGRSVRSFAVVVPEPSAPLLLGGALAGALGRRLRVGRGVSRGGCAAGGA